MDQIKNCEQCGLCKNRKNVVTGKGDPETSKIFLILSHPSQSEDETGKLKPHSFLAKFAKALSWTKKEIYMTRAVKCYAEGSTPSKESQIACYENLKAEIEQVNPSVIVALGKFAANVITKKPTLSLSDMREESWDFSTPQNPSIPIILTYSPAGAKRKHEQGDKTWMKTLSLDLKHATEVMRGKKIKVRKRGVFQYVDFFSTPYAHFHIVHCKKCGASSHQKNSDPIAKCPSCDASTDMQALRDAQALLKEKEKNARPGRRQNRF